MAVGGKAPKSQSGKMPTKSLAAAGRGLRGGFRGGKQGRRGGHGREGPGWEAPRVLDPAERAQKAVEEQRRFIFEDGERGELPDLTRDLMEEWRDEGLGAEYRIELKDGPLSNHEPDEGKAVIVYRGPGAIYVKVDKRAAKTDDETYAWRTDRPVIVITPTLENGHHREVPAWMWDPEGKGYMKGLIEANINTKKDLLREIQVAPHEVQVSSYLPVLEEEEEEEQGNPFWADGLRRRVWTIGDIANDKDAKTSATTESADPVVRALVVSLKQMLASNKRARPAGWTEKTHHGYDDEVPMERLFKACAAAAQTDLQAIFAAAEVEVPVQNGVEADKAMLKTAIALLSSDGDLALGTRADVYLEGPMNDFEQMFSDSYSVVKLGTFPEEGKKMVRADPPAAISGLDAVRDCDPWNNAIDPNDPDQPDEDLGRDVGRYRSYMSLGGASIRPMAKGPHNLGTTVVVLSANPLGANGNRAVGAMVAFYLLNTEDLQVLVEFEAIVSRVAVPDAGELQYRDRSDDSEVSGWAGGPRPDTSEGVCEFGLDHLEGAMSPETIKDLNQKRIAAAAKAGHARPPLLEFGAVVVHPSQAIIFKRDTPFALVHIGQTFSVTHNFLQPHLAKELYEDTKGQRRCKCEVGNQDVRPAGTEDLSLRAEPEVDE